MADQFADLENALRQARLAQQFIDQANALLDSSADRVAFSCANPPYGDLFSFDLPRSVWGPVLQSQVDDASATVASATGAVAAVKANSP